MSTSVRTQRACILLAPVMIVMLGVGFTVFAGWIPPPSPGQTAQETADMYREHNTGIKIGLVMTSLGAVMLAPLMVVISVVMQRIEGRRSPLALIQLVMLACLMIEFIFPVVFMQAAAFRPNSSPEVIQGLHDVGWLTFVGITSTAVLQWAVIGICILQDRREDPLMPRWTGYITLWLAFTLSSGSMIVFFKSGPFAWNGAIAFFLPISAFALWLCAFIPPLLQAVAKPDPQDENPRADLSIEQREPMLTETS